MWHSLPSSSPPCEDCEPEPAGPATSTSVLFALVPFVAAFALVNLLAVRRLFPRLSSAYGDSRDGEDAILPSHAPAALRHAHAEYDARSWRSRTAAWTFGTTVALAATLALLILAEILDVVDPLARELALRLTVPALLLLVVLVIPWLECSSLVSAAGCGSHHAPRGRPRHLACALQLLLFTTWLLLFWAVGRWLPAPATGEETLAETLTRACLERIGVVGITLMALLAGFASVSSPWHTFAETAGRRRRPLTEVDISRKQAGLDAASDMLLAKRQRLQSLERKLSGSDAAAAPPIVSGGIVGRLIGSLRGVSNDEVEVRALRLDIAGLETMEAGLASSLALMRDRHAAARRAATSLGRLCLMPSYLFSGYCVYRVLATSATTLRRAVSAPSAPFPGSSDQVSRILGLAARHWDPTLDQQAWARAISFALSGLILLASANSVVQTLHLLARWAPRRVLLRVRRARHARARLPLAVGQMAATYVVSASLLLRGQLPAEAGGTAVGGLLRGALSARFVDGWFETCFLAASVLTALVLFLGRRLAGPEDVDEWDELGATEALGTKRL